MHSQGLSFPAYLKSFARLIRLPNVLILVLTQFMLRYSIIAPNIYPEDPGAISTLPDFLILTLTTLLIAIGGYVINDYFDVKIDRINRPDKQVVNRVISPRTAIKLHMLLNGVAILLGFYLAYRIKTLSFGFIFPFISALLWIYSAKYKRMLFWGNFIVAATTSFVILIVWLFEFFWLRLDAGLFADAIADIRWVTFVFMGYAMFAFLLSMIREIIKDMEDAKGDETYGCKTIPLVAGIKLTRYLLAALIIITMVLLAYAQIVIYRLNLQMVFWYFCITIQFPAIYLLVKLFRARDSQDYHYLSNLCKVIMVAGILSMELILISN